MLTFFPFQCVAESRPSEENVAVEDVDTVSDFLQSRFASNLRHIDPGQHIGFDQVALRISRILLLAWPSWIPETCGYLWTEVHAFFFVGGREISTGHFKSAKVAVIRNQHPPKKPLIFISPHSYQNIFQK